MSSESFMAGNPKKTNKMKTIITLLLILTSFWMNAQKTYVKITKDDGTVGSIYASRLFSNGQAFGTEITFFNDALHPSWKRFVGFLDKWPGVSEVKTPRAVRTGCHTETTTDAPMKVHQNNPV